MANQSRLRVKERKKRFIKKFRTWSCGSQTGGKKLSVARNHVFCVNERKGHRGTASESYRAGML